MDFCGGKHGVIVALFLTLKFGRWHCQEAEISPIILEIRSDSLHQRLLVEWSIPKIYESDMDIKFHIQVARSDQKNIIANEYLAADLSRSRMTFSWTWDSRLPLECDSHSVRIRSTLVGNILGGEGNWSEWSPWKTLPGENKERGTTEIYPYERVVPEGSDVTFCCLPGRDQTIQAMKYGRETKTRELHAGTDTYAISVRNVKITKVEGTNVFCAVNNMKKGDFTPATVLIVTRLPDDPEDFSCETQDMQTLRCRWNPGEIYNFYGDLKINYILQEWFSVKSRSCSRDQCDWPIEKNQQIYNFTLMARSKIGEKSISAIVHVNQRVLLIPPSGLSAEYVNASSIRLSWYLKADYTSLQILCQVDLQKDPEHKVNMTSQGKYPINSYGVNLSGLQANTLYNLRVRCMAESSLAGWSNWSYLVVRTSRDVPTGALDVWRRIEDNDKGRTVTLYWRPSPLFRSNGNITHYTIKHRPLEGPSVEEEISVSGVNYSKISIGRQAYSVSVIAHNTVGRSSPAKLRIPPSAESGDQDRTHVTKRTISKDGGIFISWQQKEDFHGYVVEWCAVPRSLYCDLRWKKYNSTIDRDVIKSGDFTPGVRYNFRIYGSMKDGEHLLEKMTGYLEEQVSGVKPNPKISKIEATSIFLDWSPYPTDDSQKGFVIGYNVYVHDTESDCNLGQAEERVQLGGFHMCKFYIKDPNTMQMTINELKANGKYEVAVGAVTGGGEARSEFHKVNTPSDTGAALRSIIVHIIIVAALALVLLFLGCWKRAWLKKICLPEIPDPNKSKIFSFNGTKGTLNGNILPTTNYEPQMVDSVSVQENEQRKTYEEAKASPEHQLHEMYTTLPTRESSERDDCSGNYIPYDENSTYSQTNDPSYISQPLPYLQFFNETYTGTMDDVSDGAQGYRPQTNVAQVHCPPYAKTSAKPESGFDDEPVICFSGPDYGSEPISPTSVGSSTLIIVD